MHDDVTNRLLDKVDEIQRDIGDIKTVQGQQHESLKEHIRRTELLEARVEPLEQATHMWAGAGKLLMGLVAFGGLVIAALKLFL